MDAFQYWRQPTWAYTTNDESEQRCRGLEFIVQELERHREESLQQGIRMENTMKSMEKKCKEINEGLENISKRITEAILPCFEEKSIIEEEKEEQPCSKWEELLEICITEVQEKRMVTDLRLMNLERNTDLLEQGFASLVAQVGELEYNVGNLATAIGSKEKEKEQTDPSPAVDHPQRPAAHLHGGPPGTSQPAEADTDIDAEQPLHHFAAVRRLKVSPQNHSFLAMTP